jgi:hypothetical protein
MNRAVTAAAALTGIAALLAAGYAAAGATGLIDVASVTALGVLIIARGMVRGPEPRPVRPKELRQHGPALRAEDFPAYAKIASDLEWARMSRRNYQYGLRPLLARLAAALARPVDLTGPAGAADVDGPGVDRATLERIVGQLEGEEP